jgi:hypothetical protein
MGREPSLLEVLDGTAQPEADKVEERYLRVALSSFMRAATVQEVQMTCRLRGGVYELTHRTLDGVYDAILLKRFQRLVDLIVQAGLVHVDFGMLCEDAPKDPAVDFSEYVERYGVPGSAAALLFFASPPIATSTVFLDVAR